MVVSPLVSTQVRFADRGAFAGDLKARADAYFEGPDGRASRDRRDLVGMYLKSLAILVWFVSSWALLVFAATTWWQALLAAVSLGLSIAGVGMSVQHDANHGAFSKHVWINRVFGSTLDVMGVNSFIWRHKHNTFHHTFTNIQGVDFDMDFGILARLSPEQRLRPWHRWQHLYMWFFYGFLLPKWVFYDDFIVLRSRLIGVHKLPHVGRATKVSFYAWKIFFVGWSIVIPAMFHPLWQVAIFHFVAAWTLGATLGTVFQLAHCLEEATFPPPPPSGERMKTEWAEHQMETTVDFAPKSALVTWFVGGLNFQVEHHLFPKVCHLHYPALAEIVADVSRKHGIQHRRHLTLGGAIASHFVHLRTLGAAA